MQLAIALRNRYRYVKVDETWEAEKDVERFDAELELQLQGELDEAIKSSAPFPEDVSTTTSPLQVRFDETADESSWTSFKRESKSKIEQLAKTLNFLSDDDKMAQDELDNLSPNTPPGSMTQLSQQHQHSPRRQLPLLDGDGALAERNALVNAKQYSRILKRRYARQLMEDYFRSLPQPKPARTLGSMRRLRGPGGRFLTAEEVRQVEAGQLVGGSAA